MAVAPSDGARTGGPSFPGERAERPNEPVTSANSSAAYRKRAPVPPVAVAASSGVQGFGSRTDDYGGR